MLIEIGDLRHRLDAPFAPAPTEKHDDIDGLHDQIAGHGHDGFLDQLLQPQ
jgi:hypothetical protein